MFDNAREHYRDILAEIRTALRRHRVGQYANLPLSEDDAEGI